MLRVDCVTGLLKGTDAHVTPSVRATGQILETF